MKASGYAQAEGALATDFYQLTVAQVYYRHGLHERPAQFEHFFRTYPDYGRHKAGFCIHAGLEWLLDWMGRARFGPADLECLRAHRGRGGQPLFDAGFLGWLGSGCDFAALRLRSVPEGRVVHPHTPLTVVEGPLAAAQILETPLLNTINYQTLIATKAARVKLSAEDGLLLEFGARRAHGSAALAGSRAALIGGADFTSNTGLSYAVGLPPKGTHAHSLVQAFLALGGDERDAFQAFADSYPDDCVLLVDTVDTLESGIPNAIKVFEELKRRGHRPVGIRLDSGDLAYLALRASQMLDAAGFPEVQIVLSNQLDELVILQILTQIRAEARDLGVDADHVIRRLVYGVGTALVTSRGDGALDGVYKLTALQTDGQWRPILKLSQTPAKVPTPGRKELWRLYDASGKAIADVIAAEGEEPGGMDPLVLHHVLEEGVQRSLSRAEIQSAERLLEPVSAPGPDSQADLEVLRQRRREDLRRLHPGVKRIVNPHRYHVSLTEMMWKLKRELVERWRPRGS
jgi:nicotinate phosphoribosyltransferase